LVEEVTIHLTFKVFPLDLHYCRKEHFFVLQNFNLPINPCVRALGSVNVTEHSSGSYFGVSEFATRKDL